MPILRTCICPQTMCSLTGQKTQMIYATLVLVVPLVIWPASDSTGGLTCRLSACLRILLIFIAILSSYSIHLLLKCAGVVGELFPASSSLHVKPRPLNSARSLTCLRPDCVFSLRHPRLRAAGEPSFWSPGETVGRLHHHHSQHRRYVTAPPRNLFAFLYIAKG